MYSTEPHKSFINYINRYFSGHKISKHISFNDGYKLFLKLIEKCELWWPRKNIIISVKLFHADVKFKGPSTILEFTFKFLYCDEHGAEVASSNASFVMLTPYLHIEEEYYFFKRSEYFKDIFSDVKALQNISWFNRIAHQNLNWSRTIDFEEISKIK